MDEQAKRKYSYADLMEWPEQPRYELIEGAAVMMASPELEHQRISMRISAAIFDYLKGKPCEVFHAPFDVRLFEKEHCKPEDVDTVVQPDILVVCDTDKLDKRGCKGAPDMVVEILSPSNAKYDLWTKYRLYEKAGVREYWIADPETQMLAVFLLRDGTFSSPMFYTKTAKVKTAVLGDCLIDLGEVFAE